VEWCSREPCWAASFGGGDRARFTRMRRNASLPHPPKTPTVVTDHRMNLCRALRRRRRSTTRPVLGLSVRIFLAWVASHATAKVNLGVSSDLLFSSSDRDDAADRSCAYRYPWAFAGLRNIGSAVSGHSVGSAAPGSRRRRRWGPRPWRDRDRNSKWSALSTVQPRIRIRRPTRPLDGMACQANSYRFPGGWPDHAAYVGEGSTFSLSKLVPVRGVQAMRPIRRDAPTGAALFAPARAWLAAGLRGATGRHSPLWVVRLAVVTSEKLCLVHHHAATLVWIGPRTSSN